MSKGTLIVIDGTDGSGKGAQSGLLMERFASEGRVKEVKLCDFPRYSHPSAYFVERYLRGEYGAQRDVGARRASLFYALDRYDASSEMREWLDAGNTIVSNRYVSSNMAHQAGQIADPAERANCVAWIKELEYGIMGLPVPDVNILLYVPPEVGQERVDQKSAREYTRGKKRDILEADIDHQRRASEAYLEVAEQEGWTVIYCMTNEGLPRSKEDIHEEIWTHLRSRGIA